ncbi:MULTISPECIES: hypothetical protein [Roseomonas]|jgi:hypothetical protein|uniref:Uncharacterized protein n=2 Tax=Roseomonas TaxID=125216 RepID=A0A5B2TJ00_9PROT|nr:MULTISPECIES: hypothetical protein [Pseudoroseomonas]KAA2214074.1 hypothetical protein F0Q34_08550 [Pseudoroseomonas oryzae]MCI0756977.1 hypothetical protein [Pseudoroseomonas vastitatis]
MSKAHMPPVPPENQPKVPGADRESPAAKAEQKARPQNNIPQNQGRSADIQQNTTHQGYQQDR